MAPVKTEDGLQKLRNIDPFEHWKQMNDGHSFSYLVFVARRILSIPATSSDVERLFSLAGRVISDSRTRLLPSTAERLILLSDWIRSDETVAPVFTRQKKETMTHNADILVQADCTRREEEERYVIMRRILQGMRTSGQLGAGDEGMRASEQLDAGDEEMPPRALDLAKEVARLGALDDPAVEGETADLIEMVLSTGAIEKLTGTKRTRPDETPEVVEDDDRTGPEI
jgi:hypothetical protein